MTVEVAIRAFCQAERPVDVDAEARVGEANRHASSMPRASNEVTPRSPAGKPSPTAERPWRGAKVPSTRRRECRAFPVRSFRRTRCCPSGRKEGVVAEVLRCRVAARTSVPSTRPRNVSQWPSGQTSASAQAKWRARGLPARQTERPQRPRRDVPWRRGKSAGGEPAKRAGMQAGSTGQGVDADA